MASAEGLHAEEDGDMGRGLRARAVGGSFWTSESARIMAAVTLATATMSQERGNDLEVGE